MKKILIALIVLLISGTVFADLTATEGLAIDLSSAGAGTDFTIAFDPTELLGSLTWGDASTDTIVWTWNRATGTDPTMTFNSGSIGFLGITVSGAFTGSGVIILGDGGDNFSIASDGIDIDVSGNITNAGTIASGVLTVTGVINTSVGLDAVGAVDMDYGSGDVTDHTFLTDGVGTAEIVLPAGSIDGTEILDDTIDSDDYAAASIDNEHLADDAVDSAELATDAVGVDALDQTISPTLTGRWTFAGEDTGTDVIGLNVNWAAGDPTNGQTEGDFWYDSTLNLYKGYTTHEIILGSAEQPGIIQAKKGSGGTISAGDAVYITGFDGTDLLVELADADDAAKMPAIGIAEATINSGTAGSVTTFGLLEDIIDTSGMAVGDGIFVTVTGTTGNTLTNTKPTGATTAIQRIATVASVAVSGELFVAGALRTNDESNLTEAYLFVGNSSSNSTAVAMSGDVAIIANGTTTIQLNAVALTTDTTGNYADGDAEAGSALTGDAAVDFFGAGVDAVTDTVTCTDIEGTGLAITAGTLNWTAASTDLSDTADLLYETELDSFSELDAQIADKTLVNTADGVVWSGNQDFGGADLELPQASPGAPDADGEIELDFTDGSVVIQHGSAHAELGAATDVVIGKLIRSFGATFATPDGLQSEIDNWPLKAIESTEFPHGIVITRIYLKTSASSTYAVNVENWDDPTTINGANPTIDAITTSTSTEATETTITYSTIGAGQIIMLDLPTTDISWFTIQIEYYEPIS